MLWLKLGHFYFYGHQALQGPMIKQQIKVKILIANLNPNVLTGNRELPPGFEQELADIPNQCLLQVGFVMAFGQVQKLKPVTIPKHISHVLRQLPNSSG